MKNFKSKITSRKFIVSVISIICGILGVLNIDDNIIAQTGSVLMAIIPSITYIITEGSIDRASVAKTINDVSKILDKEETHG